MWLLCSRCVPGHGVHMENAGGDAEGRFILAMESIKCPARKPAMSRGVPMPGLCLRLIWPERAREGSGWQGFKQERDRGPGEGAGRWTQETGQRPELGRVGQERWSLQAWL